MGLGGKGNEGVAGLVKQTPNASGYVELIYAIQNNMPYGAVKNSGALHQSRSGQRHAPRRRAQPKTCRTISAFPSQTLRAKTAYPISSFTWLLIPAKFQDAAKRDAIKGFLKWMLADGQNYTEALSYAKLPKEVVEKELKAIRQDSIEPKRNVATANQRCRARAR